jgi:hypothetical protein
MDKTYQSPKLCRSWVCKMDCSLILDQILTSLFSIDGRSYSHVYKEYMRYTHIKYGKLRTSYVLYNIPSVWLTYIGADKFII